MWWLPTGTRWRLLWIGFWLASAIWPARAQPAEEQPSAQRGRQLYTSYCARCHGVNMVSSNSAFFDLRKFPIDQRDRFERSVSQGVRAMPAWGGVVKPPDVQSLWLYVVDGR